MVEDLGIFMDKKMLFDGARGKKYSLPTTGIEPVISS